MSLNKQVAKGALWMMSLRIAVRAIGFVSTIILARLLSPEDFGLVAIIMSFFAFIDVLGDFGFDTVLIQKQDATIEHYNTAWSFNFSFGLIACICVAGMSGFVADFYGNQKLQPIMLSLSVLFLFGGLQNIGVVDFRKELTFEKEFKFQIIPKMISFIFTITLAFLYRNYWALVIGSLIWKGSLFINSYLLNSFRPYLTFSAWKDLFNFSKWLMINNFFYFINTRSPEMIVGRMLSPQATGFFTIAQEISTLPTTEIAATVNRSAYPGYSKISHQFEALKVMYLNTMSFISLIVVPAGVGIASIAEILIPVVLGPQWLESIAVVRYTAIGGALMALNSNTGYVFLAMGQPKISTTMNFLRATIFLPLFICMSYFYHLEGAAMAVLFTTIVMFFCYSGLIILKLKISFQRILSLHLKPAVASGAMWLTLALSQPLLLNWYDQNRALVLLTLVISGALTYGMCVLFIWILSGRPEGPEKMMISYIRKK